MDTLIRELNAAADQLADNPAAELFRWLASELAKMEGR